MQNDTEFILMLDFSSLHSPSSGVQIWGKSLLDDAKTH